MLLLRHPRGLSEWDEPDDPHARKAWVSPLVPTTAADSAAGSFLLPTLVPGLLMMAFTATVIWLILTWPRHGRRLMEHGTPVPGTLEAPVGSVRTGVRVRFHTREGHEESVRQNLFIATRIRMREVTVYYDPVDPRRAHASGVRDSLPFAGYAMVAVFLLFFVIGLGLVVLGVLPVVAPDQ